MKRIYILTGLLLVCSGVFATYRYTPPFSTSWGRHIYGGPPIPAEPSSAGWCLQGSGACGFLPFPRNFSVRDSGITMLGYDRESGSSSIAFSASFLVNEKSRRSFANGMFIQEGDIIINAPGVVAALNELRGTPGVTQYTLNHGNYFYSFGSTGAAESKYIIVENVALSPYCLQDVFISANYAEPITLSHTWIASRSITSIVPGANVVLDASAANNGYVQLNPGFETKSNCVFFAQVSGGCVIDQLMPAAGEASFDITGKNNEAGFVQAAKLIAYPNPAAGIIYVVHPPGIRQLHVYDVFGTLLFSKKTGTNGRTEIDLKAIAPGTYILRAEGYDAIKILRL